MADLPSVCPHCDRAFRNIRGLGQHIRQRHEEHYNAAVPIPSTRIRWLDEEVNLLVQLELSAPAGVQRRINEWILERWTEWGRTLESIRGKRRSPAYRALLAERRASSSSGPPPQSRLTPIDEAGPSGLLNVPNGQLAEQLSAANGSPANLVGSDVIIPSLGEEPRHLGGHGGCYEDDTTEETLDVAALSPLGEEPDHLGGHEGCLRGDTVEGAEGLALESVPITDCDGGHVPCGGEGRPAIPTERDIEERAAWARGVPDPAAPSADRRAEELDVGVVCGGVNGGHLAEDQPSVSAATPFPANDEPSTGALMTVGVDVDPPLVAALRAYRDSPGGDTVMRGIVVNVLEGRPWEGLLEAWLRARGAGPAVAGAGRRVRGGNSTRPPPNDRRGRRAAKRAEYGRMQSLWHRDKNRAVKEVLEGGSDRGVGFDAASAYWTNILGDCRGCLSAVSDRPRVLPSPVLLQELTTTTSFKKSAAGPDGLSPVAWRGVGDRERLALLNAILLEGRVPEILSSARTVLIPKIPSPSQPQHYRPITVNSVVARQLSRVLLHRMDSTVELRGDQRGFVKTDGCAENTQVLGAIIRDARFQLKQLHVASLDISKAFDTIMHQPLMDILDDLLDPTLVPVIRSLYSDSTTTLVHEGSRSNKIRLGRGVRQGDPLSPFLFNLAAKYILDRLSPHVGYDLRGVRVGSLAFADDVVLVASTAAGLRARIRDFEVGAGMLGMKVNAAKSVTLSLVPSGKERKIRVCTDFDFRVEGGAIAALAVGRSFSYLGVRVGTSGLVSSEWSLAEMLERVGAAPLKASQKMEILRLHVLPTGIHPLVLGGVTVGDLIAIDRRVRAFIRTTLNLPRDTPEGFFHAKVRDGGLGVPSFSWHVPLLTHARISRMATSSFDAARAASETHHVIRRINWATDALQKYGGVEGAGEYWARRLYDSVDGKDLGLCARASPSYSWVNYPGPLSNGTFKDLCRLRSGSLPSAVRTSRGRREGGVPGCRAGCPRTETTAHIIQGCGRTHDGRIKRHDAVVRCLADDLKKRSPRLELEYLYSSAAGNRKPDIVMAGPEDRVTVIDVQVVSALAGLEDANKNKIDYYSGNSSLIGNIAERFGVAAGAVTVLAATISWKGVWCPRSFRDLRALGVPKTTLNKMTLRAMLGSIFNFSTFMRRTFRTGPGLN